MITRVGFFLIPDKGWLGGINYFKNLFIAITATSNASIEVYLIVPANVDQGVLDMMLVGRPNIVVVRTKLLQAGHPLWMAWRAFRKLFASELFIRPLVRRHRLDVISHSDFLRGSGARTINWLPDFQHIHLPQMFGATELQSRTARYRSLAEHADRIILSSEDAQRDLRSCLPHIAHKARVLQFVSSVPVKYWALDAADEAALMARYQLQSNYFYVPNQFWQHKNHMILLEAIRIAREKGSNVQIVCSGAMVDPRSPDHFSQFQQRAAEIGCGECLRVLGIIPYEDVFSLIRFSCAVVNPSKFEGWSSTVEECKSVSKLVLLSDLPVHREQLPQASFFDPNNPEELADLMIATLSTCHKRPSTPDDMRIDNQRRFAEYGARYLEIVAEVAPTQPLMSAAK